MTTPQALSRPRGAILAAAVMVALAMAACEPPARDQPDAAVPTQVPAVPATEATSPQEATVMPTEEEGTEESGAMDDPAYEGLGEPATQIVHRARTELAAELDLEIGAVELELVEQVTWSDGALGCPRAGEFYIQQIIHGYNIVLMAEGERYVYHSDDRPDGTLIRCPGSDVD